MSYAFFKNMMQDPDSASDLNDGMIFDFSNSLLINNKMTKSVFYAQSSVAFI